MNNNYNPLCRSRFSFNKYLLILVGLMVTLTGIPVAAQDRNQENWSARDFEGIWLNSLLDITEGMLPGEEISFTPFGAQKHRAFDMKEMSLRGCEIKGLQRHMQSTFPFMLIQKPDIIVIAHEDQHRFRLIYLDGRSHPKEIHDIPEPFGHSIGHWEGDTLVVDSVGFTDTTWMDRDGLAHSEQLHLIEKFKRTGVDTIQWTVTVEDPVYFTKPFSYAGTLRRQRNTRLMTYNCENEKDLQYLESVTGDTHRRPEVFKFPK
jgi:hypothetical protein